MVKQSWLALAASAAMLLSPRFAGAARPFATDDAGTVAAGSFELETAVDYWRDAASFTLGAKHGITGRMDLGVGVGRCLLPAEEQGFHGAEMSLKFSVVPDLVAAAFSACLANAAYGITFVLSKPFGPYSLHLNAGYTAVAFTNDFDIVFGVANELGVGRVTLGVEISGTHNAVDWWQGGARLSVTEWLAVDAGIGGGFLRSDALSASAGLCIALPVARDE